MVIGLSIFDAVESDTDLPSGPPVRLTEKDSNH